LHGGLVARAHRIFRLVRSQRPRLRHHSNDAKALMSGQDDNYCDISAVQQGKQRDGDRPLEKGRLDSRSRFPAFAGREARRGQAVGLVHFASPPATENAFFFCILCMSRRFGAIGAAGARVRRRSPAHADGAARGPQAPTQRVAKKNSGYDPRGAKPRAQPVQAAATAASGRLFVTQARPNVLFVNNIRALSNAAQNAETPCRTSFPSASPESGLVEFVGQENIRIAVVSGLVE